MKKPARHKILCRAGFFLFCANWKKQVLFGVKIPGKKTLIDADKLRAVVDDIRLNLPTEIKQAKMKLKSTPPIMTNNRW